MRVGVDIRFLEGQEVFWVDDDKEGGVRIIGGKIWQVSLKIAHGRTHVVYAITEFGGADASMDESHLYETPKLAMAAVEQKALKGIAQKMRGYAAENGKPWVTGFDA